MNPEQVRKTLLQTLEDRRMTRGERKGLDRILDHLKPDIHELALYRNVAFDLAREINVAPQSTETLDWLEEVIRLLEVTRNTGDAPAVAEYSFAPQDDCPARITGLLGEARNTIDICVFTITDNRVTTAIIEAYQRKIAIRIISDDDKSGDLGSDIDRLQEAGIPVRIDRTDDHMHHKFAIFDHQLLLNGSYNWTRSAAERNRENLLVTGEPRFIEGYARLFEELWEEFS
jgi:phosphatidylserine/phosphatidylglycerophosphate/cardiolipin synthase-like enzyme